MSAAENKSFEDISKEQEQLKKQQEATKHERERLMERAREIEEEKKNAPIRLKTKPVPAVVTLIGGAVAGVVSYIEHFELRIALIFILISLCVFLILGDVIKILLDRIELPPLQTDSDDGSVDSEGEMVEKGSTGSDETLIEESEGTEGGIGSDAAEGTQGVP
ncbi:MAG: hypothetical protein J5829_02845 [Lachnospiraceae bacterium]|nr:hypothetical protein [Lachnospiraceae bacterium]